MATYDKQVWPDATRSDSLGARLNHMEEGIYQASLGGGGGASVTICTSTTRPASPTAGAIIFETDTDKSYVYAESAWQLIGTGAAPSGAAGGGLSGTYPNPTVSDISGIAAGGVLAGTYPNPSFASLGSNVTTLPVGTIIPFAGATAPAGWLFCFGQAVSRTTYADLYAAITNNGATFPYGSGDGSTTFNLPDLRGRIPAGKDDMGGTAASRLTSGVSGITGTTLGAAGGSEALHAHTHIQDAHNHSQNPHAHAPNTGGNSFFVNVNSGGDVLNGGGSSYRFNFGSGIWTQTANTTATNNATTATNQNTGTGASQNVQPTLVTNYIIKAVADAVTSLAVSLSGSAGGVLAGSYPNPSFAPITNTCVTQPVGTINPYAGSDATVPAGWLFCGGQAVSRTTYADLFAVIGSTYGAGDGSTTFNVPDLRGRVLAGKDNMGGTAANRLTSGVSGVTGTTLGAAGGSEALHAHTHIQDAHNHTQNPHRHYMYYRDNGAAGSTRSVMNASSNSGYDQGQMIAETATNNPATATNQTTGTGASQNVQPTIVTNYIIKALADTTSSIAVAIAGAAGGDLSGSYPNPTVTNITNAPVHNSNTSLSFRTSGTERVGVDSSGRVTKPAQPGFLVSSDTGYHPSGWLNRSLFPNSGGTATATADYNVGGHWSSGTGNFTAPVAGRYMFYVGGWGSYNGAGNRYAWSFYINGAQRWIAGANTSAGDSPLCSHTIILNLAANDYVQLWMYSSVAMSLGTTNHRVHWGGHLLG